MKIIEIEQNTPEWLSFRKSKIGASDAPIIFGKSPYRNAIDLWREKIGIDESQPVNEYMQKGKDEEPNALKKFNAQMGEEFKPIVIQSDIHEWLIASLDGFFEGKILEIKCNGAKNRAIVEMGEVPDAHYCQIQHQLFAAEGDIAYYFSYEPESQSGIVLEVCRDDQYIEKLLEKEKHFLECLRDLKPPI